MRDKSTERFLELLEAQNARIAATEAKKKLPQQGLDPIRLQREEERRAKYETLRARAKPSNRGTRVQKIHGPGDVL